MFDRLIRIIGNEQFEKIKASNILLIGIGGVGGYTFECLIRSGIQKITIVDCDIIEESNLNRQIISHQKNIHAKKVDEAKKRGIEINPNCQIQSHFLKLTTENIKNLNISGYDFIIDACDDTLVKKELIITAKQQNIPIISCMGTANRMHPEMLTIQKLKDAKGDPLAKKIKEQLSTEKPCYLNIPIICSIEPPIKKKDLGTFCPVPMAAASLLASYVIQKIIEKSN